jgi:hypothetical protein
VAVTSGSDEIPFSAAAATSSAFNAAAALAPAPASSFAASASAVPSSSLLYRDALTSVLSFLSLRELAAAMAVNQAWSTAVLSMRPAMLPTACSTSSSALDRLLSSPLRRHIGQLGHHSFNYKLHMLSNQLRPLAHALPHLHSLTATLHLLPDPAPVWQFPSQLQRLQMFVSEHEQDEPSGHMDLLLTAVSQLQQLHTLVLHLQYRAVSLAPLQQLPLLRDLELFLSVSDVARFATELRTLHLLHRLHIGVHLRSRDITAAWAHEQAVFAALMDDAPEGEQPPLQWRDFHFDGLRFADELTPLLLHMPLLERLEADLARCSEFVFLAALPKLAHLDMHVSLMVEDTWQNLLAVFTSDGLARLRTLALWGAPCSEDELTKLLSHTDADQPVADRAAPGVVAHLLLGPAAVGRDADRTATAILRDLELHRTQSAVVAATAAAAGAASVSVGGRRV